MKINLLFWLFVIVCSCHSNQKKTISDISKSIEIKEFYPYHDSSLIVANSDNTKDKLDFFLVKNYIDNSKTDSLIEEFTVDHKDTGWKNYSSYQMVFYKESTITNDTAIKKHPRNLERYSQDHDWIFSYGWSKGKLIRKRKVLNGEYINTIDKITIEDTKK